MREGGAGKGWGWGVSSVVETVLTGEKQFGFYYFKHVCDYFICVASDSLGR